MNITKYNQENLRTIQALIETMSDEQFKEPLDILSGASIGAHVRHILEFYICLLRANSTDTLCYDDRERNQRIENDRSLALVTVNNIRLTLEEIKSDRNMKLKSDFSASGGDVLLLDTSLFRELAYCFEHSVHHEALIKVGTKHLLNDSVLIENFGLAPSTVRHRNG